ncbi:MAG: Wzz/FepE/Etk N-terminal domain-containing protein [Fibromonadales bacterium]|nr:Wzz/FepE/Etk N-terminal domain-containing protein [Fibromonadales bacterium]
MSQNPSSGDIDLFRLIARILRHRKIAIVTAIVVVVAVLAYLQIADKFYRTTTKFVYQSSTKQGGNLSTLAALAGFSIGSGSSDDGSAYMEDIIKSKDFLSQFANREWFIADTNKTADTLKPTTLEKFWEIELDSSINNIKQHLQEAIIEKILKRKYVRYEQDKKTGIISLITQFEDTKLSYDFNVAMFEELNNTLLHKMHFKAAENRKFIEERLAEVKNDLEKSEEILLRFQQQNRSWTDPSIQLQESRLARDVTINQELALQLQKQYELAKIEEARDMPLLDVIESPRRALKHFKPKLKIVLAIGLAGGIILGLVFALGFDFVLTERKNLAEQVEKAKKELS